MQLLLLFLGLYWVTNKKPKRPKSVVYVTETNGEDKTETMVVTRTAPAGATMPETPSQPIPPALPRFDQFIQGTDSLSRLANSVRSKPPEPTLAEKVSAGLAISKGALDVTKDIMEIRKSYLASKPVTSKTSAGPLISDNLVPYRVPTPNSSITSPYLSYENYA